MALLAYLVMIASLVTGAFLGFEWIETSSLRTIHNAGFAKSASVIEKRKNYLASLSAPRPTIDSQAPAELPTLAATLSPSAEPVATVMNAPEASVETTAAQDVGGQNSQRTHAHRSKTSIARRLQEVGRREALGYGAAFDSDGAFPSR